MTMLREFSKRVATVTWTCPTHLERALSRIDHRSTRRHQGREGDDRTDSEPSVLADRCYYCDHGATTAVITMGMAHPPGQEQFRGTKTGSSKSRPKVSVGKM